MRDLKQYREISEEVISVEDHADAGQPLYVPLTDEQVAEIKAKIPQPDKLVDFDVIRSHMVKVSFKVLDDMETTGRSVVCIIELKNGFQSTGISSVLVSENFNEELGKHYAYKKAFDSLIPVAAFLKREEVTTEVTE